jgi:hypothetical protein
MNQLLISSGVAEKANELVGDEFTLIPKCGENYTFLTPTGLVTGTVVLADAHRVALKMVTLFARNVTLLGLLLAPEEDVKVVMLTHYTTDYSAFNVAAK